MREAGKQAAVTCMARRAAPSRAIVQRWPHQAQAKGRPATTARCVVARARWGKDTTSMTTHRTCQPKDVERKEGGRGGSG